MAESTATITETHKVTVEGDPLAAAAAAGAAEAAPRAKRPNRFFNWLKGVGTSIKNGARRMGNGIKRGWSRLWTGAAAAGRTAATYARQAGRTSWNFLRSAGRTVLDSGMWVGRGFARGARFLGRGALTFVRATPRFLARTLGWCLRTVSWLIRSSLEYVFSFALAAWLVLGVVVALAAWGHDKYEDNVHRHARAMAQGEYRPHGDWFRPIEARGIAGYVANEMADRVGYWEPEADLREEERIRERNQRIAEAEAAIAAEAEAAEAEAVKEELREVVMPADDEVIKYEKETETETEVKVEVSEPEIKPEPEHEFEAGEPLGIMPMYDDEGEVKGIIVPTSEWVIRSFKANPTHSELNTLWEQMQPLSPEATHEIYAEMLSTPKLRGEPKIILQGRQAMLESYLEQGPSALQNDEVAKTWGLLRNAHKSQINRRGDVEAPLRQGFYEERDRLRQYLERNHISTT